MEYPDVCWEKRMFLQRLKRQRVEPKNTDPWSQRSWTQAQLFIWLAAFTHFLLLCVFVIGQQVKTRTLKWLFVFISNIWRLTFRVKVEFNCGWPGKLTLWSVFATRLTVFWQFLVYVIVSSDMNYKQGGDINGFIPLAGQNKSQISLNISMWTQQTKILRYSFVPSSVAVVVSLFSNQRWLIVWVLSKKATQKKNIENTISTHVAMNSGKSVPWLCPVEGFSRTALPPRLV